MIAAVDIAESLAAREKVKQAIANLREQLRSNAHEIGKTETAISRLEHGHPPFDDLKAAIVEHALSWSEAEARREIVNGITELGSKRSHSSRDKPMTYRDLLKDLPKDGTPSPENVNALRKVLFSEHALHYYCRDVVRAKLTELLNELNPSHFHYDNVDTALIGPNWKEREVQLSVLKQKLGELQKQKLEITDHLVQLGVSRTKIWED